jgi:hypothetical protein
MELRQYFRKNEKYIKKSEQEREIKETQEI